jgi:hypothetical protein
MRCEDVEQHLADHLRSALEEPVEAELRAHLRMCAACRTEIGGLEELWGMLEDVPADGTDAPRMRARFDATLAGYREGFELRRGSNQGARSSGWIGRWWTESIAAQGCAAVMLLALGVSAGRQMRATPSGADLAELRHELHDVREMLAVSLMQQASASDRLRGVGWSNRIEQPNADVVTALLDTLKHDSNVNVRLATVDALRRFSDRETVRRDAVQTLADSSQPLLQIALIDFVVDIRDPQAVGPLQRLAGDVRANEAVRARALWGLERLRS